MIKFLLEISLVAEWDPGKLFIKMPKIRVHISNEAFELLLWGDPVCPKDISEIAGEISVKSIIDNIYGHYYYILINKKRHEFHIGNSLFSILPMYYYKTHNSILLSDNAIDLGIHVKKTTVNKRFVLETLLFNYPVFNSSILEEIYLLPSNSYISLNPFFSIIKHTNTEDLFGSEPVSWRESVQRMTFLFLEKVKKYLPEEEYANALTGGFDGRTLVSAGLFHKRSFSVYTFGNDNAGDVRIARSISAKAGIPFNWIALDDDYINNESYNCGINFIFNASGTATFSRAHYLYAAKKISEETDVIVTGNFGSEIFRALHKPGIMISGNFYTLFNAGSTDVAFKLIENSAEFSLLDRKKYKEEWESLRSDIIHLPFFNRRDLTKNQKFYIIVFEEIFRKYFGAEMINQFNFLRNRTPFLDYDFLKEILKTELSGVHSQFTEHNPLKRFKGQILYSHIIHKAYPLFGTLMTDKGYRPDDLLSFQGKLNILGTFIEKQLNNRQITKDPHSVEKAWIKNQGLWTKSEYNIKDLFNLDLKEETDINTLFKVLSLACLVDTQRLNV